MEPALLGVVLDSSSAITAERQHLSAPEFIATIKMAYGDIALSLSPVTVAELVHGIYRAVSPDGARQRRNFTENLISLIPVHPATTQTALLVGRIQGEEAAKGNTLPFNDLMIAAAAIEQGYAVSTENLRHFAKIPGLIAIKSVSSPH